MLSIKFSTNNAKVTDYSRCKIHLVWIPAKLAPTFQRGILITHDLVIHINIYFLVVDSVPAKFDEKPTDFQREHCSITGYLQFKLVRTCGETRFYEDGKWERRGYFMEAKCIGGAGRMLVGGCINQTESEFRCSNSEQGSLPYFLYKVGNWSKIISTELPSPLKYRPTIL